MNALFRTRFQEYIFLIQRWWWKKTTPGYYGIPATGDAMQIIRATSSISNVIYDLTGNCVGDEDYIHGEWRFHPVDWDFRHTLPAIAYWRTKRRKPEDVAGQAEVIDDHNEIVGYTTFTRS